MAPANSYRQSSSAALLPTVPNANSSRNSERRIPTGIRATRAPTASPAAVRCLPTELQLEQSILLSNKVVLCFVSEFSGAEARNWIQFYNLQGGVPLTLCEELANALYVVKFEVEDRKAAKALLLASSSLGVGDIFASVNDYTLTLNPCSQCDFRHLVTVNIRQGSPALFGLIQFLTAGIGKYVKGSIAKDHCHITAVVESTSKVLPGFEQFRLNETEITTVNFDYIGRNLRCCYCFSYRHSAPNCRLPRPELFSAPDIIYNSTTHAQQQSAPGGNRGLSGP